jgi:NAD(P)-dependent dehydrogenase (short-subunit alcohol dehydrogenase family)
MSLAIVTGGSRGIGAATAARLRAAGHDVLFSYRADADAARAVAEATGSIAIRADVAEEADVLRLFAAADELGDELRVLVNNAGIVASATTVAELSVERIRRIFDVNVLGTILCCREAVRRMPSGAAIVNVGSVAARLGSGGQYVDYAASKAAVDTLTVGLAAEVARQGIRVNCVRPGIIDTEIHASGGDPGRAERLAPVIPMQRPGTADEIAATIAWLCSDEASYMTGAIVDVSGGR